MPLWGGASDALLNRVQVLLNTTARWVSGCGKRTMITTLMQKIGWFNIREQIMIATAMQTWKNINWRRPQKLGDRWLIDGDRLILQTEPRLHFSTSCFRWRAASQWNLLPPTLRQEPSISNFKRMIRRYVLDGRDLDPGELDPQDD